MMQFKLRTLLVATVAVAVVSAIAVFLRPRNLRHEIEKIAKTSTPFNAADLVGDFSMTQESLQLNSDGTYCVTIYCCFGVAFVETRKWSLERNLIDFSVNPSSTNSRRPMRWAYAIIQNGKLAIIPDYFTDSHLDRGGPISLAFRPVVVKTANDLGEQSDRHQAADQPL
jgi:hypothetical protein